MRESILYQLFSNLEQSLKSEMKIRIKHNLEDGKYREFLVKRLLKKIIPAKYEITNGFIIDSENNKSDEIDIIIYDKSYVPPFFEETYSIIPIESVIAVIQMKTTLTWSELESSKENLNSIDKLISKTGGKIVSAGNGNIIEEKRYIAPYKIIMAFNSDISKKHNFEESMKNQYLDMIYILDDNYSLYIKNRKEPQGVVAMNYEELHSARKEGEIMKIDQNRLCNFSLQLLDKMKVINNAIIINYKEYIKEENNNESE